MVFGEGRFTIPRSGTILLLKCAPAAISTAQVVKCAAQRAAGATWRIAAASSAVEREIIVSLELDPSLRAEQYHLRIMPAGVRMTGRDARALFYAAQTFKQLLRQFPDSIPAMEINDWPDFPARGVMLDISRDKVPTMATLFALVDELAEWKINQLQLYTEHTFAYAAHPEVWATASPMTGEEILALDEYCRARFIELVPNQNSFGHMERWLRLPHYAPLAESIDGSELPWGGRWQGPAGLCPGDSRSIELIEELYDELLPHFTSRMLNVGCDETWDLGQGRSKAECEKLGKGRVYLNFLRKIHKLASDRGRTMQFWGDIILHQPELIRELPKDVIALQWGYFATHPFERDGKHFADAGIPFYVCPGTSTWQAFVQRTDNALENLRSAAEGGLKNGAIGYLNTDWGDMGHHQYLPASYLGLAAGAAYSWCYETNRDASIIDMLNVHIFRDRAGVMGRLIYELGNVYKLLGKPMHSATQLFRIVVPYPSEPIDRTQSLTIEQLTNAEHEINSVMSSISDTRMDRPDADLIIDEIQNSAALMRLACRLGRHYHAPSESSAHALSTDLRHLIREHRRLWLARNCEGGLRESSGLLEAVVGRLKT